MKGIETLKCLAIGAIGFLLFGLFVMALVGILIAASAWPVPSMAVLFVLLAWCFGYLWRHL
jgi:hypothetical protein